MLSERPPRTRSTRTGSLSFGPLPELVGYNLRKAQLATFQHFQSAVAPYDVTPGQFGVLTLIRENEGLSQSDLGSAVGIDRSTMVAVIDRLEARGLVVRAPSPTDRRSYALRLSPEGQKMMDEIVPRIVEHDRAMVAKLNEDERELLLDCLRRVTKAR